MNSFYVPTFGKLISKTPERIQKFRLAIVTKDDDTILMMGTVTFIDDVLTTGLFDIKEVHLRATKEYLIGMVYALLRVDSTDQLNLKGLALATYYKLESLAWKTYQQLIRKAYRPGTELRAKHLCIN